MRKELTKKEINKLHATALAINAKYDAAMLKRALTNKEKNAIKRLALEKSKSPFCASVKPASQAFIIDLALTEYHTFQELIKLPALKDMKESRIRSHIAFLEKNFPHMCKKEVQDKQFRFVAI